MSRRRTLGLALLVALAGCLGTPIDQPFVGGNTVHLGNDANETYRFDVVKAQIGYNVTVERTDGDYHTFELGRANGFGSESSIGNPIASVDLPESSRRYGTYTLAPGERKNLAIEIRQDEVLLVVVSHESDGRILGFHGVHCRPVYLASFTLTVRERGEPELYWRSGCGPK